MRLSAPRLAAPDAEPGLPSRLPGRVRPGGWDVSPPLVAGRAPAVLHGGSLPAGDAQPRGPSPLAPGALRLDDAVGAALAGAPLVSRGDLPAVHAETRLDPLGALSAGCGRAACALPLLGCVGGPHLLFPIRSQLTPSTRSSSAPSRLRTAASSFASA